MLANYLLSMNATWRQSGIRDTVVVMAVLLGLVVLLYAVPLQPFQIPGYLLLLGFLPVEAVVGEASAGVRFYALFGLYLLVLSVVGSVAATVFRQRTRTAHVADWRFGVAGGLAVTSGIALLFGVRTLLNSAQLTPTLTVLATGLVLLVLAGFSAGLLGTRQPTE